METNKKQKINMEKLYKKNDISFLKGELKKYKIEAKKTDEDNDHKLCYSNANQRQCTRLRKLIELIETGVKVEDYGDGLVLINDKFVVSLQKSKWRVLNKSIWYWHKHDVNHFINTYITQDTHDKNK